MCGDFLEFYQNNEETHNINESFKSNPCKF